MATCRSGHGAYGGFKMNTRPIYNLQTGTPVAVAITGDYSGVSVCAMNDLVIALGGANSAFHEIKRLERRRFLPRMGGEGKPLTLYDLELARRNEALGHRHWQWRQITIGRHFTYGYGFTDGNEFVFVNQDGSEFDRLPIYH